MNEPTVCKIKALTVGIAWGLGILAALAGVILVLTGLFMLGEAVGINFAAIISAIGFGIICIGFGKIGYDRYLDNCRQRWTDAADAGAYDHEDPTYEDK